MLLNRCLSFSSDKTFHVAPTMIRNFIELFINFIKNWLGFSTKSQEMQKYSKYRNILKTRAVTHNTSAYCRTQEVWKTKVHQSVYAFISMPKHLKDESICMYAVKIKGVFLAHVPDALRNSKVCRAAVRSDPDAIHHVPRHVFDYQFIKDLLRNDALGVMAVLPEWMKTQMVCDYAFEQSSWTLIWIPFDCQNGEMVRRAMRESKGALRIYAGVSPIDGVAEYLTSEAEECSICLSTVDGQGFCRTKKCGHIFHPRCLEKWCYANPSCPMCRTSFCCSL